MKSDILLITPPFTQLNTPYPATAYLKGFLNTKDISSFQIDLGIEVICALFTKIKISEIFDIASGEILEKSPNAQHIFQLRSQYANIVEVVIHFLQGKQPTFARNICSGNILPQASRFDQLDDMELAFGSMGIHDKAKHLATLFLEDLSDFIIECVDPNFGFSRYAERLGRSANSFDELYDHLSLKINLIESLTIDLLDNYIKTSNPFIVCISVPFPGNLLSAFRCAQFIKKNYPNIKIAMGGGFANTELRSIKDERVFEFFDFITLDDGEIPIELLIENNRPNNDLNEKEKLYKRTFLLENGNVFYNNLSIRKDYKQSELGTPSYADLSLDKYISVIEIANPMHSLWSDGRWNKLTMAHGCYWGKCTFCDISLDYIKLYEPIAAKLLVDRMEELIEQTNERGFHFVDEAAPPALMRELSLEILRRGLVVTWWTNIRFEKSFTADLCYLLQASGCIAISGGLEVASNRLLKIIDKGVTVEQVAQVNRNFTESGIMVHAYLMYGYPTQTTQETVDSLEMVRQMFELGILQSGFWHQFALTAHSPIGLKPEEYGIKPQYKNITFANNDIAFTDSTGIDHEQFAYGLKKSLFNYLHGLCFEYPLQDWFDFPIPETTIKHDFIELAILDNNVLEVKPTARIIWVGIEPKTSTFSKSKAGKKKEMVVLTFHNNFGSIEIKLTLEKGKWLQTMLTNCSLHQKSKTTFSSLKTDFETDFEHFELFWYGKSIQKLRGMGLLVL